MTHFLLQHGYMIVFAGVLAEQLGLPFPSGSLLLAAGALLGTYRLNLAAILGIAIAASLISDSVWYCLGRRRGGAILVHACRVSLDPDTCVSQMHRVYSRFGAKALLFCKFVPGLGTLGPPMAGMVGLAPWKFLSLDAGGAFGLGLQLRPDRLVVSHPVGDSHGGNGAVQHVVQRAYRIGFGVLCHR